MALLEFFEGLHPWAIYVALGVGAALENVMPPIPADTFVLFGGFLAAQGRADIVATFLSTWLANVAGALFVYELGRRRGEQFFNSKTGARVMTPGQLETVDRFYQRWGVAALFITRFLPGLRAVVPVFAGVAKEPPIRVVPPIFVASAVWYGALVWGGASARGNLAEIEAWIKQVNQMFFYVAVAVLVVLVLWWRRSRAREY